MQRGNHYCGNVGRAPLSHYQSLAHVEEGAARLLGELGYSIMAGTQGIVSTPPTPFGRLFFFFSHQFVTFLKLLVGFHGLHCHPATPKCYKDCLIFKVGGNENKFSLGNWSILATYCESEIGLYPLRPGEHQEEPI